jgi:hypothetical protein
MARPSQADGNSDARGRAGQGECPDPLRAAAPENQKNDTPRKPR